MSLHEPARWIVTYDIAHPRRGQRMLKLLKKHGVPLQYSVFIVDASATAMHALMHEIRRLIRPSDDDVRAYRLPMGIEHYSLGGTRLPDGTLVGWDIGDAGPADTKNCAAKKTKQTGQGG